MKTRITTTFAASLLLLIASGCKVAPGSDPFVVNAERAHKTSFELVTLFLETDNDNRELVKQKLPEVHRFAEDLRAPDATGRSAFERNFEAAWASIQFYKANRTEQTGNAMVDAMNKVSDLARAAQVYLVQMEAKAGVKPKRAFMPPS